MGTGTDMVTWTGTETWTGMGTIRPNTETGTLRRVQIYTWLQGQKQNYGLETGQT